VGSKEMTQRSGMVQQLMAGMSACGAVQTLAKAILLDRSWRMSGPDPDIMEST
jgi:hypothetical protein